MSNYAYVTYDGIQSVLAGSYTRNHGISPSVATIDFVPQIFPPEPTGTLTFWYNGIAIVEFPDCKLDAINLETTDSGIVARAQLFDRRWMYKFGEISGIYNVPQGDDAVKWEMTPRELADLCFEAMNETTYDASVLPNDARPEINWDGANPAQALADLVEQLGCRIVLRCDNSVRIEQVGVGDTLPDTLEIQAASLSFDPPESPDAYCVLGAPIWYQMDLFLYAVGKDTNGSVKPLDALSYAPADGWAGYTDIPAFNNLANDANARAAAQESVMKWYAINPDDERNYYPPGFDDGEEDEGDDPEEDVNDDEDGEEGDVIDTIDQLLPLNSFRADTVTETVLGESITKNKDPLLYGIFIQPGTNWNNNQPVLTTAPTPLAPITDESSATSIPLIYFGNFSIDYDNGIVKLSEPLYMYDRTDTPADGEDPSDDEDEEEGDDTDEPEENLGETLVPAQLVLRIAVCVRDAATHQRLRHMKVIASGTDFGTLPRYDIHEEIQRTIVPTYDSEWEVSSTTDNKAEVDAQCDNYLYAMQQEYITPDPETITYASIKYIELDGAIQQVTWSVGPNGGITRASLNHDFHPHCISYKQRRLYEKMAALAKAAKPGASAVKGLGMF